jgi:hypothetical protein
MLKSKKQPATGPPRFSSLPARKHRIAKASPGLCAKKREQRKAYAAAAETEDPWCVCCGRPGSTDHSHLYSQGRFPEHRNNPLNWLLKCRQHHELFENNKPGFAAQFPAVWAEILRRLPLIDAAAFAEFQLKNNC